MSTVFVQLLFYLASFLAVWWGSGLVVSSVSKLAYGIKLPAFVVSFFVLGLLTSLPEIAIGLTAISTEDPGIFVGNLIGGIIVIFLFVIPLLGMVNSGLKAPRQLNKPILLGILIVTFLPTFFISDKQIQDWEALICIFAYLFLFFLFSKKREVSEKIKHSITKKRKIKFFDILKIIVGVCILILGSNQIVNSTLYFADVLSIAPFFVSLIVVSLGTNIPEITLVFRSIFQKNSDVAIADFLGSAAANTLLFGILSLIYPTTINTPNHYFHRLLFIIVGLILLYVFIRSKNLLSKKECAVLLILYVAFIITELLIT